VRQPLPFCGYPLDRAERERRDDRLLAELERREESRFLPLHRLRVLVRAEPADAMRSGEAIPGLAWARGLVREWMDPRVGAVLLGLRDGVAHFAVDLSPVEQPLALLGVEEEARFEDLRSAALRLPAEEAAVAGHARARVDWHARHGFCPACGGRSLPRAGGAHRRCGDCGAEHFPRTDPVAIAAVVRGDRCLLGRQRGWPPGLYSALAGFIETGESVEEAVRREVREETGVEVGAVRYLASQSWPFPSSLMLGCIAEAESETVELDEAELEDARWFHRDALRAALRGEAETPLLPPPLAIAHHLVREWVREE